MAQAPLHDKIVTETVTTLRAHSHNQSATARALGIDRSTLRNRINIAIGRGLYSEAENPALAHRPAAPRQPFGPGGELHLTPPPAEAGPGETLDELVARKKRALARAQALESHQALIPVDVPDARPIGLLLVGDPHVDDDGCDIARLESDLRTVAATPGFFAGHVGDLTNNWVGRLARLYAAQSTSFADGLRLTEWMLGLCPNLFVVGGNHDCWNQGMDLLGFISRQAGNTTAHVQAHGARLALRWPDGAEMRLHARHDFPGRSQFSDTHGMKRELLWGHRDHILVAGHTHVDEARVEPSLEGQAHWMFRVSGYKIVDDYARANHLRPKRLAPSVAVVLDPTRPNPADRVKPFWDAREAADYLTWRRGAGAKPAARPTPRRAADGQTRR